MTNLIKNVIVIGATGLMGKSIIKVLHDDPSCQKITVVVRRENETFKKLQKIEQIILDDFFLLDQTYLEDKTHAMSCLGSTIKKAGSKQNFYHIDCEINVHFAKLCQNLNVQYLLISALGANATSLFFYNRVKGELENDVKNLKISKVSIFQPSLLLGQRDEQRFAEDLAQKFYQGISPLLPNTFKYKPVTAVQLAHTMVEAMRNQAESIKIYDNLAIHNTK